MSAIRSVTTAVIEANFDWTIIRIETADGAVGWGESFFAPGLTRIIEQMGDLIVGDDARNIERIGARLRAAASGAGSVGGIVHNALSGIDAALWDLAARQLGVPLWRLLGGRFHESVRVYADCHGGTGLMGLGPMLEIRRPRWAAADAIAEGSIGASLFDPGAETEPIDLELLHRRAAEAVGKGFDALKFDLDVPGLVPERAGSRTMPAGAERLAKDMVDAIRDGAGPGVELAFDLHWRYDVASAVRLAEAVSHAPILWLEDPLPPENVAGLISLAQVSTAPIGGGENLIGYRSFDPLIQAGSLSVVTPDLGKFGGVNEARRLAAAAHDRGLQVAPHNIAGPIGTAFAAQVSSTWPNFLALEFHAQDVPFFDEVVGQQVIVDGSIPMTDRPGIGFEPDLEVVRRWAKPGERIFGDDLDD
ncbi:mandelate racemase/muconate lactonizing enzyme family protein [Schumannella luteola]|uniref:L-alanine-DL-glutamate epimerase-like enolase superfamily enzyme n=1 Tax=Schumannella luteola TaxID=472059 RepID=A0A852YMC9_9MICO|nr:mandelate racemase/muconate lactonizing enzyme family protein [Schumannella luteola]NYG98385.1 L-alanine-DL-glutamate epimerase-like enolase superfamily enzyme [Schumannella luteola]